MGVDMKKKRFQIIILLIGLMIITAGCSSKETMGEPPPSGTENGVPADRTLLPVYSTRHIYGGILSMLAAAYELPDMEIDKQSLYDGIYAMSDNWFAVMDVDGDGREELIISYSTSSMAGMFEIVYCELSVRMSKKQKSEKTRKKPPNSEKHWASQN